MTMRSRLRRLEQVAVAGIENAGGDQTTLDALTTQMADLQAQVAALEARVAALETPVRKK